MPTEVWERGYSQADTTGCWALPSDIVTEAYKNEYILFYTSALETEHFQIRLEIKFWRRTLEITLHFTYWRMHSMHSVPVS